MRVNVRELNMSRVPDIRPLVAEVLEEGMKIGVYGKSETENRYRFTLDLKPAPPDLPQWIVNAIAAQPGAGQNREQQPVNSKTHTYHLAYHADSDPPAVGVQRERNPVRRFFMWMRERRHRE